MEAIVCVHMYEGACVCMLVWWGAYTTGKTVKEAKAAGDNG